MKRVWIYPASRDLTADEKQQIEKRLNGFVSGWAAHGHKLDASYEIPYDRFIVLKVNESGDAHASGCSLDASTDFLREIESEHNLSLMDRSNLLYVVDGKMKSCALNQIGDRYREGDISPNTLVVNPQVITEEEYRTNWFIPFKESGYFRFI